MPPAIPVSRATTARWGMVSTPSAPAAASEAYSTTPAPLAVRMSSRRSTRSARTPAGSRAPHMPSRKGRLDDRRPEGRAAEGVGDQGEHEHAHVAAQVADGLARPEDGEVAVLGEVRGSRSYAHHILRNYTCAIVRAEFGYHGAVAEIPKMTDVRMLRGIAHPMRNRILEGDRPRVARCVPRTSPSGWTSRPTRRASTCASWRSTAWSRTHPSWPATAVIASGG